MIGQHQKSNGTQTYYAKYWPHNAHHTTEAHTHTHTHKAWKRKFEWTRRDREKPNNERKMIVLEIILLTANTPKIFTLLSIKCLISKCVCLVDSVKIVCGMQKKCSKLIQTNEHFLSFFCLNRSFPPYFCIGWIRDDQVWKIAHRLIHSNHSF